MRASGTKLSAADGGERTKRHAGRACLIATLLAGVLAIGGTVAWVFDGTDEVINTFESSEVTCAVVEDLDGAQKKDVKVKNTGDVDGYVRAAIVVNWVDENGNVLGVEPVREIDYKMVFSEDGWIESVDGFWYWAEPVGPGESTGALIESCMRMRNAPEEGYCLSVEILASAIQADGVDGNGTSPVVAAWGVAYDLDTKKISKA